MAGQFVLGGHSIQQIPTHPAFIKVRSQSRGQPIEQLHLFEPYRTPDTQQEHMKRPSEVFSPWHSLCCVTDIFLKTELIRIASGDLHFAPPCHQDTCLILGASRRTVGTGRPSLVFRLCHFQEINDAHPT